MTLDTSVRTLLLAAIALLAAACAETTPQQHAVEPGDNGAFCGGTPINKENCQNNQQRM
jgi:hypothetical protein